MLVLFVLSSQILAQIVLYNNKTYDNKMNQIWLFSFLPANSQSYQRFFITKIHANNFSQ